MQIGRVSEIVDYFERGGFLSGDAIWIDGVHDREIVARAEPAHDAQRVVEVAFDGDDFSAVRESLEQLAACDFSGGQDDGAANPGARGVGGGGRRGVSGGGADHRERPAFDGLRHGYCHSAILE